MYRLTRKDPDIEAVLDAAMKQQNIGGSRWPGQTYEDGVAAAVDWLIGASDDNPMTDD